MKIIGLTGGSGTGKGTVAALMQAHGAGWVDADAVYHTLCTQNQKMLGELAQTFGDVLTETGTLDRKKLAGIVFSDREKLSLLNQITTPYIRRASVEAILEQAGRPIVLYDAPTLFESGADTLCQSVIGVLADRETRIRRVIERDGLSEQAARARVLAQPEDDFYRARCAYLIENNGSLTLLAQAVDALYQKLV